MTSDSGSSEAESPKASISAGKPIAARAIPFEDTFGETLAVFVLGVMFFIVLNGLSY